MGMKAKAYAEHLQACRRIFQRFSLYHRLPAGGLSHLSEDQQWVAHWDAKSLTWVVSQTIDGHWDGDVSCATRQEALDLLVGY